MKKTAIFLSATLLLSSYSFSQIQNQYSSAQTADFWITGKMRTTGANAEIILQKDGSNSITSAFHFRNSVWNRAVNLQLTGDANPGLGTWIYNGVDWLECMRVMANGNVGIGTTAPAYKLDVNGTTNVTGALTQGGNQVWHAGNLIFNSMMYPRGGVVSTALDGATLNGFYTVHYNGYSAGLLSFNAAGSTGPVQMLYSYQGELTYRNKIDNNTWTPWKTVWNSSNFTPANYLALAGGNITGNVNIGTTAAQKELNVNGNIKARKIKVTATDWADYVFDSSYQLAPLHQVEKFIQQNKRLPEMPAATVVAKEGADVGDTQVLLLKKIEELTLYIIEQNKQVQVLQQQVKELQQKVN